MTKKVLLPIFLFMLSACKTKLNEQHPVKYLYLDKNLPFVFNADSYGEEIVVVHKKKADEYEGNYRVTTDFFVYDSQGNNFLGYTTFTVDLYNSQEFDNILEKYEENPPNVMREQFDQCFPEVPYTEKGKKTIKLNLYNQQTGQVSQSLAGELYTFGDWRGLDESDKPKYIYWIIINQAPGLPKNKTLRILLNFPAPYHNDPDIIKLKADISQKICEYAKSFTWVEFNGKFSPNRWKEIPWSNKYPHPKVTASKRD